MSSEIPPPEESSWRGAVTELLQQWGGGEDEALEELLPLVWQELHRQAENYLRRESSDHTLQPTALIHEAYLHLSRQSRVEWQSREHFFAIAATLMRRVLVKHAQAKRAAKRGGQRSREPLEDALTVARERSEDLLALDLALERLAALQPRQARTVELRFFGGFTVEEAAGILEVSSITIKRDWRLAKAWLKRQLEIPSPREVATASSEAASLGAASPEAI
ncbi:MAG: sigma-70 family RNA polymerase sigma factor [Deltaproteobacteria bacterium]|nr:sigma-70 family RNA polymerase sigma factor [Deltaproteobacteria bacterium]